MTAKRRITLAIGVALLLSGLGLLLLGVGATIERSVSDPIAWNLDSPSEKPPLGNVVVESAICRFDARWSVKDGSVCIVPLVRRGYAKPASGHDFSKVSLLYRAPCGPKSPVATAPCQPNGYLTPWSKHRTTLPQATAHFKGYRGLLLDAPSERLEQARRRAEMTMFGFALTICLGGLLLIRIGRTRDGAVPNT